MNKKLHLLSALAVGSMLSASAVLMLPEPRLISEEVQEGKVKIQ